MKQQMTRRRHFPVEMEAKWLWTGLLPRGDKMQNGETATPSLNGQVEKGVQDARHRVLQLMPDFPELSAMNAWLDERCIEQWTRLPHGTLPGAIAGVWAAEWTALMPRPPAFDRFVERRKPLSSRMASRT